MAKMAKCVTILFQFKTDFSARIQTIPMKESEKNWKQLVLGINLYHKDGLKIQN